jgi:hypothetical protein
VFHHPYPLGEVAKRAERRIGEEGEYKLLGGLELIIPLRASRKINCEHFATWCRTGNNFSDQIDNAWSTTAGLSMLAVTAMFSYVAYDLLRSKNHELIQKVLHIFHMLLCSSTTKGFRSNSPS